MIMKLTIVLLGVGFLAGCSSEPPDAMPDDAMRVLKTSPEVPVPTAAMAQRSGTSLNQLGEGHSLFLRKCSECHEPRVPENPGDPSWHPTMRGMAWNAGLTESEEGAMIAYLRAAGDQ
jgi:mono/diheme cytochrome c family protein